MSIDAMEEIAKARKEGFSFHSCSFMFNCYLYVQQVTNDEHTAEILLTMVILMSTKVNLPYGNYHFMLKRKINAFFL